MAKLYTTVVMCIVLMSSLNEGVVKSALMSVHVCPGGQLNLTCDTTSDVTLLVWNITFSNRPGFERRFILSTAVADSVSPLTVGETEFQFLRTSTSPLTSMMVIDNVATSLNGTRVECSYGGSVESTTVINVIRNGVATPDPIMIPSGSEQFANETVTIFLTRTIKESDSVLYSISVFPQATVMYDGTTNAQLTLSYNTSYNVSLIATRCGQNASSPSTELRYVKCVNPIHLLSEENTQFVKAEYNYPPILGTIVTFNCTDPGLMLDGPNSSTCIASGEWEPDPRDVKCIRVVDCGAPLVTCINVNYSSTLENSTLHFSCNEEFLPTYVFTAMCLSNGSWVPDPVSMCKTITSLGTSPTMQDGNTIIIVAVVSSIIVFIFSSSLFFFIGCVSGWIGHKHWQSANIMNGSDRNTSTQQSLVAPVYEDLQPTSMPENEERTFELKENVAYGPVRPPLIS